MEKFELVDEVQLAKVIGGHHSKYYDDGYRTGRIIKDAVDIYRHIRHIKVRQNL